MKLNKDFRAIVQTTEEMDEATSNLLRSHRQAVKEGLRGIFFLFVVFLFIVGSCFGLKWAAFVLGLPIGFLWIMYRTKKRGGLDSYSQAHLCFDDENVRLETGKFDIVVRKHEDMDIESLKELDGKILVNLDVYQKA